jgi:hypothetical protein
LAPFRSWGPHEELGLLSVQFSSRALSSFPTPLNELLPLIDKTNVNPNEIEEKERLEKELRRS